MFESKFTLNVTTSKVKFHQSADKPSYFLVFSDPDQKFEVGNIVMMNIGQLSDLFGSG
jgi:hypothetical protein